MLILIPLLEGDPCGPEVWINPNFVLLVADPTDGFGSGSMITLNAGDKDRVLISTLSAKAVAQLCYEAKHNL